MGDIVRAGAARLYTEDAIPGLPGMVRFGWDSVDAWFEEDEQVFVRPRNPYTRVDALRSDRAVRVELDGVVLAESACPVIVFETGLPTRYYLNRTDAISRPLICEHVAKVLRDARDLGLTRRGEPAAGRPHMFALRSADIPPVMKLDGPGRALPPAVLRQLYENLSALETSTSTRHGRPAIELLMDTGHRPEEILRLRYDCLGHRRGRQARPGVCRVQVNREGPRLPITDTTAELIRGQQQAVRALFPIPPSGTWRCCRVSSAIRVAGRRHGLHWGDPFK